MLFYWFVPRAPRRFGKRLYGGSLPRSGWNGRVVAALVLGLLPAGLGILWSAPGAFSGTQASLGSLVVWAFGAFAVIGFSAAMSAAVRTTPQLDIRARGFTARFIELSVVQPLGPFPGGKVAGFFAVPAAAQVDWVPELSVIAGTPLIGLRVEARMQGAQGTFEHHGQRFFHGKDIDIRAALPALKALYGDRWTAVWHPQPIIDLRHAGPSAPDPQGLLRAWLEVAGGLV